MENNTQSTLKLPLFPLGDLAITPGAKGEIEERYTGKPWRDVIQGFIKRHVRGDWADMSDDDGALNLEATKTGVRVFSAFHLEATADQGEGRLWIITEADRSSTTILLPDEY